MARWKARVDFIFVVIELFSPALTVETLWAKIGRSRRFLKGWVNLSADFRGKGASPTNHCRCQSSRVFALSCCIKISVVCHLVLSQSTRVTDGRTEGQTDRITTPKTALVYARAVKTKKSLFEPPFRARRGNVRTQSMARWKARGRLCIRRNLTFFDISYGWDVMSGNRSKSAFFEGVGHFSADFRGKEASPTNHCWYQSSRVIVLSCGIKISAVHHLDLSQSTRVTDGRTDGQNYDSQDRPRICSRGKNY